MLNNFCSVHISGADPGFSIGGANPPYVKTKGLEDSWAAQVEVQLSLSYMRRQVCQCQYLFISFGI